MTKNEIQSYSRQIQGFLGQKQLKSAFEVLTLLLADLQNYQLKEQVFELEDHYKMMLNYLIKGIQDPQQEKVYQDLVRSVYQLSDQTFSLIKLQNSTSLFYEKKKSLPFFAPESSLQLKESLDDLLGRISLSELLEEDERNEETVQSIEKEKEELEKKIFYKTWLSDAWGSDEAKMWTEIIRTKLYPRDLICLLISAITLNQEEIFDERKALALTEACESEDDVIRQRAIVGLLLFLRRYDNRLHLFPSIRNRIAYLGDNPRFRLELRNCILQFILSKETEKITKKIKEEILPEMMKISPDLQSKINIDDLLNDSGFEEKNPEWQDMLDKSGLTDKLQEFSELQMEGADVMHSSFVHLKNYPFFNEISHWFLPFMSRSETNREPELKGLLSVLTESGLLCNSDKYSFFFSIAGMPESYRKMMTSQFSAESSAMLEMAKDELPGGSQKIHPATRQYIQDLYRFFKLYPRRRDFEDVFEMKPEFYEVPIIHDLIPDPEDLMIIAEYYFNRNYFKEAYDVFQKLSDRDANNEMFFQKQAYCLQMQGDFEGALHNYLRAELLNAGNSWTIRKIASCYRTLKMNEEALVYYRKSEALNPDDLSVQLNIGHCYLEMKQYDEALKSYFKVEYLTDKKEKAWRPIAWCSFLVGKYDQAMNYYRKILDSAKPNSIDYLNAGHTQLVMENFKEAIDLYACSLKAPDNSLEKFRETFSKDIPDLIRAGISENYIPYILDTLMYES
ncbi:hypothetical protein LJC52_01090 [Bacteroidales bacterium OttesenSCG-928-A17]|nr:hypothetical protein [Bacteroidales bacterium OttesenSCG-928-A17]